ncbi:MAG: glycoside hydrolase family 16 protein [Nocardioidaceae bacterium]|nr:glycoside hydrolase family 16 protein [Nocardioidaceae bacterium]MCL2613401.1 glycoside hydrolase family 16 protein [Nocardioidaceae bacterium]
MSRRLVLPALLLAVLAPVALVACSSTSTPSALCGGAHTVKIGSRTWTCTFDDEFGGTSLDTGKWSVQTTPASGWTTADTCYLNDPGNIVESGGALHLVARRVAAPMSCGGRYSTVRTGGAVITRGHFSQARGLFVFRARYPATRLAGFWGNLWLYPERLTYGRWPGSGEVDVAEHWSGHGDTVSPSLHYPDSSGADTRSCTVANVATFHTYAVEWGRSSMSFYYDGHLCFQRDWTTVSGSTKPFDKPFFVMLSEGFGDFDLPISPLLPQAGSVDVDYVRVYE